MAKSFDATTRQLIEMGPAAWLEYLGIPVAAAHRIRVIHSNLSTVVAEADRVIWVEEPEPWIEHIELEAGRDVRFADRVSFLWRRPGNAIIGSRSGRRWSCSASRRGTVPSGVHGRPGKAVSRRDSRMTGCGMM